MAHVYDPIISIFSSISAIPIVTDLFDALICHIDFRLLEDALAICVTIVWVYRDGIIGSAITDSD